MWNAGLDELQAGIKTALRNINNLTYAYDICTLTAQIKKELRSLLIRVKEESENAGLKTSKNLDHGIQLHHFLRNRWGKSRNSGRFYFPVLQNHRVVTAAMKLKNACSLEEKLWQT